MNGRLLTDEEIDKHIVGVPDYFTNGTVRYNLRKIIKRECEAQLAKDQSFEEEWQADFTDKIATKYEKRVAEIQLHEQARVERIKEEIETQFGDAFEIQISRTKWHEFWKKEGVK